MNNVSFVYALIREENNKYIAEYGKPLPIIYLSKSKIELLEKDMLVRGESKITHVYGVEIASHTYEKYKEIDNEAN